MSKTAVSETPESPTPFNRALLAHRIVQFGLFVTLVWKWDFFWNASRLYAVIPLSDPFFPDWLESVWTIRIAYAAAVAAIVWNLVTPSAKARRVCAWITFFGSTILCIHQGSYNDMTFVTAWWTSLWSLWFIHHMDDGDQRTMFRRAAFLSRLILSVILLGGGAGKWTAEYWSGEVFYDIYFLDRDYWIFNLLRERFEPETLREIAKWYSRQVVVVETVAGLVLWLLPARWAAAVAMTLLASIALLSNVYLVSVLACVIALASVGFFVQKEPQANERTDKNT